MRTIKTDGRYKLYSSGFHYIVEFKWHGLADQQMFSKLVDGLTDTYGSAKYFDKEKNAYVLNSEWRYEIKKSAKRRRIYLKDESALSLVLLKVGA